MATPQGFEPRLSGPKPLVLPLHNGVEFIEPYKISCFYVISTQLNKIILEYLEIEFCDLISFIRCYLPNLNSLVR